MPSDGVIDKIAPVAFEFFLRSNTDTYRYNFIEKLITLGSFYYFFISYFFWFLKIEKVLKVVKRIVRTLNSGKHRASTRPAGSTTQTAMARTPDVVPESQSQTQEAAPKAKAPKKGILAGGVEYASVPELRKKARELKLVAATPMALKALCIEVLNEYEQVQKLRSALDPSFTTEDVPEDEDEDKDAADADDGASGASGDDDSASEGGTIEDLGKVGKLPSALSFGTDAEKKGAARLLYHHLRGSPDTAYMLGLCGGDDKREQLVYCAARLHRHLATNGAVLSDSIATQELLVAAPFFPAGIVADNAIHARATAAAAAAAGAGGGAGG